MAHPTAQKSLSTNALLIVVAYLTLVLLLVLELTLRYDTTIRQVALAITNILSSLILLTVIRKLHSYGACLPWVTAWLVAIGVWFDALGNFINFYSRFSWWDKLAHGIGSAAAALALFALLNGLQHLGRIRLTRWLTALFAMSCTTLLAAIYEISEYLGDQWFATHRVTDLYDTADDLLWNTIGVVLVIALASMMTVRHRRRNLTETVQDIQSM